MKDVKETIVTALSSLNMPVTQGRQDIIGTFPSITFTVIENRPTYTLNPEIAYQSIAVELHLWDRTSSANSETMEDVEELMREVGFMLEYSSDIDDEENVSHYVLRFNYITG